MKLASASTLVPLAAALLAGSPLPARAALIYGVSGSTVVFSINPDTLAVATVTGGGLNFANISAGPEPGVLYLNQPGSGLYRYQLGSPGPVLIGGAMTGSALGEGRDGWLYSAGGGGGGFRRIDPLTGASTVIDPLLTSAGDLATSPLTGVTYLIVGTHTLATIDRSSGLVTTIGPSIPSPSFTTGLAFTLDGRLGGVAGASLYQIDPATAGATLVGTIFQFPTDLASEPLPVPAPGAAVGALCLFALRRRRPSRLLNLES